MQTTNSMNARQPVNRMPSGPDRSWPFVLVFVAILVVLGWSYLAAMVVDMVPAMDMSEAGPGMAFFNEFNLFKGLPSEARAALAALCLPAGSTFGMPSPDMSAADLSKIFAMWVMMALAMMLPSAIPMLRAYHEHVLPGPAGGTGRLMPSIMVSIGYLMVWVGYAVVATFAQWVLSSLGTLTDMMAPASVAFSISVLFAAGLYQFTPAKRACLNRCWYPRWFFGDARPTAWSGLKEGVVQGWSCLGCCWAVMTVMFAVGLMNVIWIALLGGVMALEKSIPSRVLPAAIGVVLLSWSGLLVATLLSGG